MAILLLWSEINTLKKKLRSLQLFLSAHPENEPDSEMADRLSDVEEMIELLGD